MADSARFERASFRLTAESMTFMLRVNKKLPRIRFELTHPAGTCFTDRHVSPSTSPRHMVLPPGFEPGASRFSGERSYH